MKKFTSKSQKIGEIGEGISCRYLEGKGFKIIERNYTKKWGEIDVVAEKKGVIHFIEVKSVYCNDLDDSKLYIRPEENMNNNKVSRLKRVIETYLAENKIIDWQFDLSCVYLDENNKKAKVKIIENLVL